MEMPSTNIQLPERTHLMCPSSNQPNITFATQSGNLLFFDLNSLKIKTQSNIFDSSINCVRNTATSEVLVSSNNKKIFYGQIDAKGEKEGIWVDCKGDCLTVDIAEFILAVGSEDGEICKYIVLNLF
jgi:hypothetical protein